MKPHVALAMVAAIVAAGFVGDIAGGFAAGIAGAEAVVAVDCTCRWHLAQFVC